MGAMGLADGRQHLAHREQVFVQLKMAEGAEPGQVQQATAHPLNPFFDKAVSLPDIKAQMFEFFINGAHHLTRPGNGITPGPGVIITGKEGIDP